MTASRRHFLRSTAIALAAAQLGLVRPAHAAHVNTPIGRKEHRMMTMTAATDSTIVPFRVEMPEDALADLRARIAATRWPARETVADASQGVQLATIQELASYWA